MFNRVHSTLQRVEERKQVTVQDALNIFADLCEDIKTETGKPVNALNVVAVENEKNLDGFVTGFCSAARMLARIYRDNDSVFTGGHYADRVEKATQELRAKEEALKALEQTIEDLQKKQTELSADNQRLRKKEGSCQGLKQEIRTLQKEKERLLTLEQTLQEEKTRCQKDLSDLQEQTLPQAREQLEQRQKEKDEAEAQNAGLQRQAEELRNQAEQARRKREDLEAEVRTQTDRREQEKKQSENLEKKKETIQKEQADCETQRRQAEEKIQEIEKAIQKAEEEKEDFLAQIPEKENQLTDAKKEREKARGKLDDLNRETNGIQEEARKLLEEYRANAAALNADHSQKMQLEEQLQEQLQEQKERLEQQLEEKKEETTRLEGEIVQMQNYLRSLKRELQAKLEEKEHWQEEIARCSSEIEKTKKEIERLKEEHNTFCRELEKIKKQMDTPLAYQQQRQELLTGLWESLKNDPVFGGEWLGREPQTGSEIASMRQAIEGCRENAERSMENFAQAYNKLTEFLALGGF